MLIRLFRNFDPLDTFIIIDDDDFHYLKNVMRVNVGQEIIVFNNDVGAYRARIDTIEKKQCSLSLFTQTLRPHVFPPTFLLFGPLKNDIMSLVYEKATELGVTHFIPLKTDFVQPYKPSIDKIKKQLKGAIQQCERLDLPTVFEQKTLIDAIDCFLSHHENGILVVALERTEASCLVEFLYNNYPYQRDLPIGIIVGPEGGFSNQEKQYLKNHKKVHTVSLGKNILRSETAIISSLATLVMWRV